MKNLGGKMVKTLLFFCLLSLFFVSSAFPERPVMRIYKDNSDGAIYMSTISGSGNWSTTPAEDFSNFTKGGADFQVVEIDNQTDLDAVRAAKRVNIVGGNLVLTPYGPGEKSPKQISDERRAKKDQDKLRAIGKLKALGLTQDEIDSIIGK